MPRFFLPNTTNFDLVMLTRLPSDRDLASIQCALVLRRNEPAAPLPVGSRVRPSSGKRPAGPAITPARVNVLRGKPIMSLEAMNVSLPFRFRQANASQGLHRRATEVFLSIHRRALSWTILAGKRAAEKWPRLG